MLRITVVNDATEATFKLEGKLAHEWVAEAGRAWDEFSQLKHGGQIVIDLCGVSFIDDAGRELLVRMHAFGAKLKGSGPMASGLIDEICGGPQGRTRRWAREVLSLLFLTIFSAAPRKEAVVDFARSLGSGHWTWGIPGWLFTLQSHLTHFWKGLS